MYFLDRLNSGHVGKFSSMAAPTTTKRNGIVPRARNPFPGENARKHGLRNASRSPWQLELILIKMENQEYVCLEIYMELCAVSQSLSGILEYSVDPHDHRRPSSIFYRCVLRKNNCGQRIRSIT